MGIRIEAILFRDIADYISNSRWKQASRLPITLQRALSQKSNPHAREDEPCLWVALGADEQVLGFAGSLPGHDRIRDMPVGWNTCWWVEAGKGKEAAMPLLFTFLQHWDMKVAFSDMTAHTASIIRQLDFCHLREEELLQVIWRIPGRKLEERLGWAGKVLGPLIRILAAGVNQVLQTRIRNKCREETHLERFQEINQEIYSYISALGSDDFLLRSKEEWNWIEGQSWLVPPERENRSMARKYPFSSLARKYRREWLLVREMGKLKGAMCISIRDGYLKVLYYYGEDPELALKGLVKLLRDEKAVYSVVLAHPALLAHAEILISLGIRVGRHSRWTGVSKRLLEEYPPEMHMQLGNGDVVFT